MVKMRNQFDGLRFVMALDVWRKKNELSVNDIADLTGIPHSTYYFYQNSKKTPDLVHFCRLCQLMDFDATEFFIEAEQVKNG